LGELLVIFALLSTFVACARSRSGLSWESHATARRSGAGRSGWGRSARAASPTPRAVKVTASPPELLPSDASVRAAPRRLGRGRCGAWDGIDSKPDLKLGVANRHAGRSGLTDSGCCRGRDDDRARECGSDARARHLRRCDRIWTPRFGTMRSAAQTCCCEAATRAW